jgi:hypothetical protein
MIDEKTTPSQSRTVSSASSSPTEPPSLDETISATMHLLPNLRSLDPTQLRALAVKLRILSNVTEGWAHRAETAVKRDDE